MSKPSNILKPFAAMLRATLSTCRPKSVDFSAILFLSFSLPLYVCGVHLEWIATQPFRFSAIHLWMWARINGNYAYLHFTCTFHFFFLSLHFIVSMTLRRKFSHFCFEFSFSLLHQTFFFFCCSMFCHI